MYRIKTHSHNAGLHRSLDLLLKAIRCRNPNNTQQQADCAEHSVSSEPGQDLMINSKQDGSTCFPHFRSNPQTDDSIDMINAKSCGFFYYPSVHLLQSGLAVISQSVKGMTVFTRKQSSSKFYFCILFVCLMRFGALEKTRDHGSREKEIYQKIRRMTTRNYILYIHYYTDYRFSKLVTPD